MKLDLIARFKSAYRAFIKKRPVRQTEIALLTEREREVIALVCKLKRNKEIADELCITERTVKYHLTNSFKKLNVTNKKQVIGLMILDDQKNIFRPIFDPKKIEELQLP